jgi:predicted transcriptional regulator
MKLEDYIRERKITINQFAKELDITATCLYRLIETGRDVRGSTLVAIEEATKGMCTMQEVYRDYVKKKKKIETIE